MSSEIPDYDVEFRNAREALRTALETQLGRSRLYVIYETTIQAQLLTQPSILGLLLIAVAPDAFQNQNPDLVLVDATSETSSVPVYAVPVSKPGLDLLAKVFAAIASAPRETLQLERGGDIEVVILDNLIFEAARKLAKLRREAPDWIVTTKDDRRPFYRGSSSSFAPELLAVAKEATDDLVRTAPAATDFASRLQTQFVEIFGEVAPEHADLFNPRGKLPEIILKKAPEIRVNFASPSNSIPKPLLPPPVTPPYVFGILAIRQTSSAPVQALVLHSYSKQAAMADVAEPTEEANDLDAPANARVLVAVAEAMGVPTQAAIARVSKATGVPARACERMGYPLEEVLPFISHSPSQRVLADFAKRVGELLNRSAISDAVASKALPITGLAFIVAASSDDWRLEGEDNKGALVTISYADAAKDHIVSDILTAKAKRVDKLLAAIERLLRNAAVEKKKFCDIIILGQEALAARYKAAGLQKPRRQSAKVGNPGFRLVF